MTARRGSAYRIELKRSAVKTLRAVALPLRRRLDEAILALALNPRPPGCRALQGVPDLYRIRVGDFRIVYQVQDCMLLVLIIRIGDRRDIYRGI